MATIVSNTSFVRYLGSIETKKNEISLDIAARNAAVNRCYYVLQQLLKSKEVSTNSKFFRLMTIGTGNY